MIEIYHNPRCSKSRETLEILKQKGIHPKIILYMEDVPTKDELNNVIKKLNISPIDLIRKGEDRYRELIIEHKKVDNVSAIDWMVENPKLIQRPIVINGDKAKLGRPPESVLEIL